MGGVFAHWRLALTLPIVGASWIGAVCGWWFAPLSAGRAPFRAASALAATLALLALEASWLDSRSAAIMLLGGALVGIVLHATWRSWLANTQRHGSKA